MKRKAKTKSGCQHPDDSDVSRRQFLSGAGSMGVSLSMANPLLWGLLKHDVAQAAGTLSDLRVLHLQLAGGGAGSRHGGLPMDVDGNVVPSSLFGRHYGYPTNLMDLSGGSIVIGGVPFAKFLGDGNTWASGFTKGLYTEIQKDTNATSILNNLCAVQIPCVSQNDNTPARMAGISTFYSKSLSLSSLRPKCADVIGLTNSVSGNGTGVRVANGAMTRITATSVGQLKALKSFSQALSAQGATQTQLESFAAGLKNYLNAKTKRLGDTAGESLFGEIQNSAAADLLARVIPDPLLNSNALDVTLDPSALSIFGLTAGNFNADSNSSYATGRSFGSRPPNSDILSV